MLQNWFWLQVNLQIESCQDRRVSRWTLIDQCLFVLDRTPLSSADSRIRSSNSSCSHRRRRHRQEQSCTQSREIKPTNHVAIH